MKIMYSPDTRQWAYYIYPLGTFKKGNALIWAGSGDSYRGMGGSGGDMTLWVPGYALRVL
jgi:hypothetical protein